MFTSSVIARGKAAIAGSETEQRISVLLYDDSIQVISSFELNQLASLTYHDTAIITSQQDMTDVLLDHLEKIQSQPIKFSVLTVQKSLIVTRHVLFYGAESVIPRIRQQLGRHIEPLCQYNTVLAAQQSGTTSWLMRIQGGAVDQGGPVRASAVPVVTLLTNPQQLQFERNTLADPNSLVPVGTRQQVAFCSDQVRLEQLKKRMLEQQSIQTRSNLAKADNGFGSGYNAANGKTVVGAAHGIEEMLRQQQKEEQRFCDETARAQTTQNSLGFAEYQAPNLWSEPTSTSALPSLTQETDLLAMDNVSAPMAAVPSVDLLDFGGADVQHTVSQPVAASTDLLYGSTTASVDLLGHGAPPSMPMATPHHDPFQVVSAPVPKLQSSTNTESPMLSNLLGSLSLGGGGTSSHPMTTQPTVSRSTVMSAPGDRFSALDTLSMGNTNTASSGIMNQGASFTSIPVPQPPSRPNNGTTAFANLGGWNMTTPAADSSLPSLSSLQQPVAVPESQSMAFATQPTSTSLRVSSAPPLGNDSEHSDNGFFMGGAQGTGLNPLGQAPAAPPPPPPPGSYY